MLEVLVGESPEHALLGFLGDFGQSGQEWLGGFAFESSWMVGEPISLGGVLNGKPYRETGILLAFEADHLLRYSHWSALWRVADTPQHRAVLRLTLTPTEGGTTVLLLHELPAVEALPHHHHFFSPAARRLLPRIGAA